MFFFAVRPSHSSGVCLLECLWRSTIYQVRLCEVLTSLLLICIQLSVLQQMSQFSSVELLDEDYAEAKYCIIYDYKFEIYLYSSYVDTEYLITVHINYILIFACQ